MAPAVRSDRALESARPRDAHIRTTRADWIDMDTTERVIVVGLGYVGLPLALRAVQAGFDVVGVDLSTERIARLRDANSFVEDISDGEVKEALNSGRVAVTSELSDAEWFDV